MAKQIIGLDVGSYSVKVAHLEDRGRGGEYQVVRYAEKRLSDFSAEASEEAVAMMQRQEAALVFLKEQGFLPSYVTVAGLPGSEAQVRLMRVPFSNVKKIQAVLGGLLDSQLPFDVDTLVLSWFSLTPEMSLMEKLKDKGGPAETDILVAMARRESVALYLDLLKKGGADPKYLTFKAAALIFLLQYVLRKPSPLVSLQPGSLCALVDIGHRSTGFCIGDASRLLSVRSVLRGGYDTSLLWSKRQNLSLEEAEQQKIEQGFIETDNDKAKMLEGHLLSEALKETYLPILREVQQTALSLKEQKQGELTHVFLVGGGSKVKNLDVFASQMLGHPVTVLTESVSMEGTGAGIEAALATSYGICGHLSSKKQNQFNFRKEEFAWTGEYSYMRQRAKSLGLWAVAFFACVIFYGLLQNSMTSKELNALLLRESAACERVLGKKVEGGARCLSMMKSQIAGQGGLGIPEYTASDVYLEVARVLPGNVSIKVTEFDVGDSNIKLAGETSSFESVDQIVQALTQARCFINVEKGRAHQSTQVVEFQVSADINCKPETKSATKSKGRGRKR